MMERRPVELIGGPNDGATVELLPAGAYICFEYTLDGRKLQHQYVVDEGGKTYSFLGTEEV